MFLFVQLLFQITMVRCCRLPLFNTGSHQHGLIRYNTCNAVLAA